MIIQMEKLLDLKIWLSVYHKLCYKYEGKADFDDFTVMKAHILVKKLLDIDLGDS